MLDHATPLTGVESVAMSLTSDQYYFGGTVGANKRIARYDFTTQSEIGSVSVGARSISVVGVGTGAAVYFARILAGGETSSHKIRRLR